MSAESEADSHFAHEKGRERPDQEWILSDRDAWYRNPFYTGPKGPHPEDDVNEDKPLPPDPDDMNHFRAAWAGDAIASFAKATGAEEDGLQIQLSDLLANMMHWCDRNELDFADAMRRAQANYDAETSS